MKTLKTSELSPEALEEIEKIAASTSSPELRDVLMSLRECIREGDDLVAVGGESDLTPNQAADRLGMSRTHLYKLLDSGEIMFHRVGSHRRIRVRDLIEFELQRQRDRRELAERFASQSRTHGSAVDEIVDML